MLTWVVEDLLLWLLTLVTVLIVVAFYTLWERKFMGSVQRRKGPVVVGFSGFLQPIADGFKLVIKEIVMPRKANLLLFAIAPCITFTLSLLPWTVIPFGFGNVFLDLNYGILLIFAVSGLNVYGVLLAGWSSNSKYAYLGSLRAAAQMISYEVAISFAVLPIILLTGSLNLTDIVYCQTVIGFNIYFFLPVAIIFFISTAAETNRAPFDLAEAEAEIVAGYNLEYSAIIFAMFFLGEYGNMLLMASFWVILFLGGWSIPGLNFFFCSELLFAVKAIFFCALYILLRAALPRYRFDQLMYLGWKTFLPALLSLFILYSILLTVFELLPVKEFPLFNY